MTKAEGLTGDYYVTLAEAVAKIDPIFGKMYEAYSEDVPWEMCYLYLTDPENDFSFLQLESAKLDTDIA